jgi:di/tricarboxylate transporter
VTFEIVLLLGLIVVALVFFSFEWVSADVVGLGLVLALILTGLVPVNKAFAGFGSDTVIMILSLLIMTAALLKTGVVDLVGKTILQYAGTRPAVLLMVIMIAVAVLSAFISNTAAAAFFVPVVIGIASKSGTSPSRLLMPVAFASILTSSVTLISTSTNLVVSGLMTKAGLAPMGMFELAPVGIPIAIVGIAYMFFIGQRWIPERAEAGELIDHFGMRPFLTEIVLLPKSSLVGKTLRQAALGESMDLNVVRVIRDENYRLPRRDMTLQAGDVLLVEGARENVLKVKDTAGIEIKADVKLSDPLLRTEDAALVEALVIPGSPLVGRRLRDLRFRDSYGVQVLGLNRHGKNLLQQLSHIPLSAGDVLLVQGSKTNISTLNEDRVLSVLQSVTEKRPDRARAWRAGLIFGGALTLASFNVVPLPVAGLLGAFLIFATRCVSPAEAYREVEWRAVILIGCMLALGEAMLHTGTAQFLALQLADATSGLPPLWLLGGFFLLTVTLTQPMSNQAAAAVILPIAVETAQHLGLNPRAFAMIIALAASCSYLTPLEPACLMVYGPGRYRFSDFLRIGGPLVIAIFIIAMFLVPRYWPLTLAHAAPLKPVAAAAP